MADEVEGDATVLEAMLEGAKGSRTVMLRVHSDMDDMPDSMRFHVMCLPRDMRGAALRHFRAARALRDALRDSLDLYELELASYSDNRPTFRTFKHPNDFALLKPGQREAFTRNRKRFHERRKRVIARIARLQEKLNYLDSQYFVDDAGIPPAPRWCDLCNISGELKMVTADRQPTCSNGNCKFVLCNECFMEIRQKEVTPRCPGCRCEYLRLNGVYQRHEGLDPFFSIAPPVIAAAPNSEGEYEIESEDEDPMVDIHEDDEDEVNLSEEF